MRRLFLLGGMMAIFWFSLGVGTGVMLLFILETWER